MKASVATGPAGGVVAVLSFEHRVELRSVDATGKAELARTWADANDAVVSITTSGKSLVVARRNASKPYVPNVNGESLIVPRRESRGVRLTSLSPSGQLQWDYTWNAVVATMSLVADDGFVRLAASTSWVDPLPGSVPVHGKRLFLATLLQLVIDPGKPRDAIVDVVEYMKGARYFSAESARLDAVALGCDGYLWLEGTMENGFDFGPYLALNPLGEEEEKACGRFLAIRDADGEAAWAHELAIALPCDASAASIAALPGGGAVLAVTHRGPLALNVAGADETPDAAAGETCSILRFPGVPDPSTARPNTRIHHPPNRCDDPTMH